MVRPATPFTERQASASCAHRGSSSIIEAISPSSLRDCRLSSASTSPSIAHFAQWADTKGYSLTIDRNPSPQPSPTEVRYIRLRQIKMANSGKPELDGRGSAPPLTKWLGQYFLM